MRLKPKTIMGQLIAGTLLVQLLVFGVFVGLSVRQQFRDTRTRDRQRLQRQSAIIANLLAEPLQKHDEDLLDHVVHAVPIAASIKGARITDTAGEVIRNTSDQLPMALTEREQKLLPALLKNRRYVNLVTESGDEEGAQPVIADGLVRGIVWVTQDGFFAVSTPNRVLQSLLLYAPFALVGNLLLVWALSASLARPLRRLRRATVQVRQDASDLSAFPLPVNHLNEAGALTASFNSMVREIARQRQGTQETLNLLDSLLSSAPIGFAFYDREYRYIRINERLAKLHGVDAAAHLGKRFRDLVPEDPRYLALARESEKLLESVFQTGEPAAEREIAGELPGDPNRRVWQVSYFPVVMGGEVRWVGVIATEITLRKQHEEAMRRSEKLAAAGRLAASIAHEINNPLEAVTNLLYLVRNQPSLDRQAQEWTAMAQDEVARVGEIAQQTLRFYRQPALPADVKLADLLRGVLVLHAARLKSPAIHVEAHLADDALLFGYAGELRQLFANLVGNAIDAMPTGGSLTLRARAARRAGRTGVRVTVADTGLGMSDAVRWRIFEPFFTTKENTGTGLGLWVSAEILEKHGATMLVRSRQGHERSGTVFSLFFPWDGVPRGPRRVQSAAEVLADHVV